MVISVQALRNFGGDGFEAASTNRTRRSRSGEIARAVVVEITEEIRDDGAARSLVLVKPYKPRQLVGLNDVSLRHLHLEALGV